MIPSSINSPRDPQLAEDDELMFVEEDDDEEQKPVAPAWEILMVDDDDQVHQSTLLAIGDALVHGRPLAFRHAKTAKEAIAMIEEGRPAPDLAFVDMVMESADAGLRFAKAAKQDKAWSGAKILLRSGQPGFGNEMESAKLIGVEGFAQKATINRTVLIEALETLLAGKSFFKA